MQFLGEGEQRKTAWVIGIRRPAPLNPHSGPTSPAGVLHPAGPPIVGVILRLSRSVKLLAAFRLSIPFQQLLDRILAYLAATINENVRDSTCEVPDVRRSEDFTRMLYHIRQGATRVQVIGMPPSTPKFLLESNHAATDPRSGQSSVTWGSVNPCREKRPVRYVVRVYSDNQDENPATIRMRMPPPLALGGRA